MKIRPWRTPASSQESIPDLDSSPKSSASASESGSFDSNRQNSPPNVGRPLASETRNTAPVRTPWGPLRSPAADHYLDRRRFLALRMNTWRRSNLRWLKYLLMGVVVAFVAGKVGLIGGGSGLGEKVLPHGKLSAKDAASMVEKPLLIAVMGMTGVGKSTFIKDLTQDPNITVGHSLESCTESIQHSSLTFTTTLSSPDSPSKLLKKTYNVILADTPGFDDSRLEHRTDAGILKDIADWLEKKYQEEQKLTGIIYLHRITDERLGGVSVRNLRMMQTLVGEGAMRNVMLVTNRWENVKSIPSAFSQAEAREKELLGINPETQKEGPWYRLKKHGASYARHYGTPSSATEIISQIVKNSPMYIQLQEELASGIAAKDTAAGAAVLTYLERENKFQKEKMASLEKEMEIAKAERKKMAIEFEERLARGEEVRREMNERKAELEEVLDELMAEYKVAREVMEKQQEELRILISRRGFFTKVGETVDNLF